MDWSSAAPPVDEAMRQSFYDDGYLVLPEIVPIEKVNAVRRMMLGNLKSLQDYATQIAQLDGPIPDELKGALQSSAEEIARGGADPRVLALYYDTPLQSVVSELLGGPVREMHRAQLATVYPSEPGDTVNEQGYRDCEVPFNGWSGHLDGLWNGSTRPHQDLIRPMTDSEREAWTQPQGRNGVLLEYPASGANITQFAALVGVALTDQTGEGVGNLGVMRAAHHHVEAFFRGQRVQGGPLGPDGPGWERVDTNAPNGSGLRHVPDPVREAFSDGAAYTDDSRLWPKPTFIKLAPGDAVIVLHAVPHSSSRSSGCEPRTIAYFRISPESRPDAEPVSVDALCDNWLWWPGMSQTVTKNRT